MYMHSSIQSVRKCAKSDEAQHLHHWTEKLFPTRVDSHSACFNLTVEVSSPVDNVAFVAEVADAESPVAEEEDAA